MPLNAVSVKDLITIAQINRATFYYHYNGIQDLLSRIETDLVREILEPLHHISRENYIRGEHPLMTALFRTLEAHRQEVVLLCGPNGDPGFAHRLFDGIVDIFTVHWRQTFIDAGFSPEAADGYFSFLAGGTVALILRNSSELSPEELGKVSGKMLVSTNEILSGYEK